jgi:hypothetical protein
MLKGTLAVNFTVYLLITFSGTISGVTMSTLESNSAINIKEKEEKKKKKKNHWSTSGG